MKNKEINPMTEEKYWEEMEETGLVDDDCFPIDPDDEDEDDPYTSDRMLEDHYQETFGSYYERLQKEAEEEAYRMKFWQPQYDLSGHEYPRD